MPGSIPQPKGATVDWTPHFRKIMADVAEADGQTYEESLAGEPLASLFLLDQKLWLRRILRRA